MVERTQIVDSVYIYEGSLLALNGNLVVSAFSGPTSGTLAVQDVDNERDWDTLESATFDGASAALIGTGTAQVGVNLLGLQLGLATAVPLQAFTAGGNTYFAYPEGQPSALLDSLASQILADPLAATTLTFLGLNDLTALTAYLEQNAVLTFSISPGSPIPICFTEGTLISTPRGDVLIEDLQIGDEVCTADRGPQRLKWIGRRRMNAAGNAAPVLFEPGAIGNTRRLVVSPQHRMMLSGWRAELLFGEAEVLVPAKFLINGTTVRRMSGGHVTYMHLLFDRHEVIWAEGVPSESFHPGDVAVGVLEAEARDEVFEIFPELRSADGTARSATARRVLRAFEANVLCH